MTKFLSIVVPVYNAEKTIERLVNTIENQQYDDYELILVDDESTDNTPNLLKSLSEKYSNIITIFQKNKGVGGARNTGLKSATGKYVTFIDNDDYYTTDYFETIIPYLKEHDDIELLCFDYITFNSQNEKKKIINFPKCEIIELNSFDGIKKYLNSEFGHKLGNANWNKIYVRKKIVDNDIWFPEIKGAVEDVIFNLQYFSVIKKINLINKVLYNYSLDFDRFKNEKYYSDCNEYVLRCYGLYKQICVKYHFEEYDRYIGLYFLRRVPSIINNHALNPSYIDGYKKICEFLNNEDVKKMFKKIKLRDLDFKLLICFIICKFHSIKLVYLIARLNKKRILRRGKK